MNRRHLPKRRRLRGRLALPGDTSRGIGRLRQAVGPSTRSALDVVDASERAAIAREPGHARLGLRFSLTAAIVAALFAVLVVRLWSIQVINVQSARNSTIATTTRDVETQAPRGSIEARGGQLLAGDVSELVVLLKTTIDESTHNGKTAATRVASPKTEENLATLVPGLTVKAIEQKLNNEEYGPYQPVPVASVTPAVAATIEENRGDFPGVEVKSEYVRTYPEDSLAAQMLGYVGPIETAKQLAYYEKRGYQQTDLVGVSGLEEEYESVLAGKPGVQKVEVDPAGNPVKTTSKTAAVPGDIVVLNMDLGLEQKLSTALSNQIATLRAGGPDVPGVPADWGAAVVLGPKGQVLATASEPSYNDNEWVGGMSQAQFAFLQKEEGEPLNDYVITGTQPPGSTFKLATATAALDDGLLGPTQDIQDPGYFDLPGQAPLTDAPGDAALGWINVSTALTASDDVFFYTLGAEFWDQRQRYGEMPIQNVAMKYGFGAASGVDLPESELESGWVDSPKVRKALVADHRDIAADGTWYLGDNVEMAFGQGETIVTPLEEAEAYSTFADGGTRYAPEIAAAIVSPSGKLVRTVKPKVESHVSFAPGAYQAMLTGFEGAVQDTNGTAYQDFQGFNFNSWDLAGKTGTADVAAGTSEQPTAWFVAFGGPKADPSQRYTVAVEIDQAGYGADASAPVARQVFNYLYSHKGGLPALHASTTSP